MDRIQAGCAERPHLHGKILIAALLKGERTVVACRGEGAVFDDSDRVGHNIGQRIVVFIHRLDDEFHRDGRAVGAGAVEDAALIGIAVDGGQIDDLIQRRAVVDGGVQHAVAHFIEAGDVFGKFQGLQRAGAERRDADVHFLPLVLKYEFVQAVAEGESALAHISDRCGHGEG